MHRPRTCAECLQVAGRFSCCQHGATLQIDRSGWLIDSYDTRTTDKLYRNSLTLSGSGPSHREVGRQTVSDITTPPPATYTHTRYPRNVDFVRGQYPAQISAAHWSQTHSGPFQQLGGVVASRQLRAGQLIQPADPWICTQNSKSQSSQEGPNPQIKDLIMYFFCGPQTPPNPLFLAQIGSICGFTSAPAVADVLT